MTWKNRKRLAMVRIQLRKTLKYLLQNKRVPHERCPLIFCGEVSERTSKWLHVSGNICTVTGAAGYYQDHTFPYQKETTVFVRKLSFLFNSFLLLLIGNN